MNIPSIAFIDMETRSKVDLKKHGVDRYAKDPSTEILCMAYAIGSKPVKLWTLGQAFPNELLLPDFFVGHNIGGFEWNLWKYASPEGWPWPELKIEQCIDTMAMARTMGLPGSLDGAASAAGIEIKKDPLGYRVMLQLSKPGKDGLYIEPEDEPPKFKMLYDYCKQDVEVTRALYNRLRPLTQKEKKIWILDQEINQRGVGIDIDSACDMNRAVINTQDKLNRDIRRLTNDGVLSYNASAQLKRWLAEQGVNKESVAKAEVTGMLNDDSISDTVKDVLKIRQEAAKSSTAKIESMIGHAEGGRARNLFAYHGANTGRWAGRDIQLQNMARGNLSDDDVEFALKCFSDPNLTPAIDMLYGSVMSTASSCLRSLLIPAKGHKFLCADYSNIEGRVLAWIAGEEWKVQAFKDFDQGIGHDLYLLTYARSFGIPIDKVTKDQRQIGKVLELACIAEGQLVLTQRGLVPIENVLINDTVWDGVDFVKHEGVVYRGTKEVIEYEGLQATPDHRVFTEDGRTLSFRVCSEKQIKIQTTGNGGEAIRVGENYFPDRKMDWKAGQARAQSEIPPAIRAVHGVQCEEMDCLRQPDKGENQWMPEVLPAEENAPQTEQNFNGSKTKMHKPKRQGVEKLRGAWNSIQIFFNNRSREMGDRKPRRRATGEAVRPGEQRRSLSSGELEMGNSIREYAEREDCKKTKVYDILNCGPRNRFTVSGKLVHNCGFGGGIGAFQSMAKNFGVQVTDERADELKTAWREANPKICKLWYDLENAALWAVRNPNTPKKVTKHDITFISKGSFLLLTMPSGRTLYYPYPEIHPKETPWGEIKDQLTYMTQDSLTKKWGRCSTYGGSLTENITQALARDILAEGMLRVTDAGYPIVMHVHDEIVSEVLIESELHSLKDFEKLMSTPPEWALDMPIVATGWEGVRYKK